MKLAVYFVLLFLGMRQEVLAAQTEAVRRIWQCTPQDRHSEINYVSVDYHPTRDTHTLAIEWRHPVGREDIQEGEAYETDDFTVDEAYISDEINASLLFYTADDHGGKRIVLELGSIEILLRCRKGILIPHN